MEIILKQIIAILHLLNDVSMLQRASFSSYSNYMLYIKELSPSLNTQSDSIRSKLYT